MRRVLTSWRSAIVVCGILNLMISDASQSAAAEQGDLRVGISVGFPAPTLFAEYFVSDEVTLGLEGVIIPGGSRGVSASVHYVTHANSDATGLVVRGGVGLWRIGGEMMCYSSEGRAPASRSVTRWIELTAGPEFRIGSEPVRVMLGIGRASRGESWCPEEPYPGPGSAMYLPAVAAVVPEIWGGS